MWGNPELRAAMVKRAGGRYTVPEIFIDNRIIGGYDDSGRLRTPAAWMPCSQNRADSIPRLRPGRPGLRYLRK